MKVSDPLFSGMFWFLMPGTPGRGPRGRLREHVPARGWKAERGGRGDLGRRDRLQAESMGAGADPSGASLPYFIGQRFRRRDGSSNRAINPDPGDKDRAAHTRRIESKKSALFLVALILSSRNSIASMSSMGYSSLRSIQIFCRISGLMRSSSFLVPERLTLMAG